MIDGLHFDVTASEMTSHLQARQIWHRQRVIFYRDKVDALEKGGAESAQFSGGDPVRALREKEEEHTQRAELFRFLAGHLVAGETYRLEEAELQTLEFIPRRRW